MFKSHILGCPCVMISNPEAAKFVLNKANLFKPTFPASKERMLGKQAIFFHQGEYHANLRRLVLRTFMPEAIRNIVPDIESIAQDCLKSWEGRLITTFLEMKTVCNNSTLKTEYKTEQKKKKQSVALFIFLKKNQLIPIIKIKGFLVDFILFFYKINDGFCLLIQKNFGVLQFTFNVALLSIFGKDEVLYREDLKRCYYTLEQGYNSMPINLPGTLFHKAMKARKELAQIVAQIISSRRQGKQEYKDLLGSFMGEKSGLTDDQIADNVIGVIFAARDTTASVLTWIVKYLGENPSVLQAVTVSIWVLLVLSFILYNHCLVLSFIMKISILMA